MQQSQLNDLCPICLTELKVYWTLKCGHKIHEKCCIKLFSATENKYTYFAEELESKCPVCRQMILPVDLPPLPEVELDYDLYSPTECFGKLGPIIASGDSRPVRLSRINTIISSQRHEKLIEELVEKRKRLLAKKVQVIELNSSQESSVSSSSSRVLRLSPQNSQNIINNPPNKPSSHTSQVIDLTSLASDTQVSSAHSSQNDLTSPLSQQSHDPEFRNLDSQLHAIQLNLNIAVEVLRRLEERENERAEASIREDLPLSQVPATDIPISSSDNGPQPVKIIAYWARGKRTHYRVLWNDGVISMNPTAEVEELLPEMLVAFRKELRRQNTARWRAKLKENP